MLARLRPVWRCRGGIVAHEAGEEKPSRLRSQHPSSAKSLTGCHNSALQVLRRKPKRKRDLTSILAGWPVPGQHCSSRTRPVRKKPSRLRSQHPSLARSLTGWHDCVLQVLRRKPRKKRDSIHPGAVAAGLAGAGAALLAAHEAGEEEAEPTPEPEQPIDVAQPSDLTRGRN